ncbi:MAG TPA: hypothetical protein VGX37_10640 [Allosphingosinicella sp.]|jgi:hypothetical protein|nr:hypothetical protein [Allosphingosinicella sp.]
MRITLAAALAAGLLVGACGGGQTETTEAEEALANDLDPSAPSPGNANAGGNAMNSGAPATAEANAQ